MGKNKRKLKETEFKIPIDLITSIVTRFIDTKKAVSKTNISTVSGSGLMGVAYMLINSPDPITQSLGYILGVVGFGITLYKENKKK
ncbi:MAG: hypothetical protein GY714_01555 [Desulfobacterales bacterium]|nr:hypothetical protein [Desulfobacterales bacterium]